MRPFFLHFWNIFCIIMKNHTKGRTLIMDEMPQRPQNPRRRRKTKWEVIKEAYLPTIFCAITLVLMLVFIIAAISRNSGETPATVPPTTTVAPTEDPNAIFEAEAKSLLDTANEQAADYYYQEAIDLIDSFSGDISNFPELSAAKAEYQQALSEMVVWSDPSDVTVLSFHTLIVDAQRAFADKTYAKSYNKNFVTTEEFTNILADLHKNGYILVNLDDFTSCIDDGSGNITCSSAELKLPKGKKPLLLVQTNVNYYTYMVDGDGDGLADKDGAGFASRLLVNESGDIVAEYINANGETLTGNYDLVPILNDFIQSNPDFSYRGAKAILAPSGYDGVFGYRTNPKAEKKLGTDVYNAQIDNAKKLISALQEDGYVIACYTYNNKAYGKITASEIQADLKSWTNEVTPILGDTNILVFAQNSDLTTYSGSKFNVLQNAGFRYYIGIGSATSTDAAVDNKYIALKRLNVTGSNMAHTTMFTDLFNADVILDPNRGNVPK